MILRAEHSSDITSLMPGALRHTSKASGHVPRRTSAGPGANPPTAKPEVGRLPACST
jgi:hypothetical protein